MAVACVFMVPLPVHADAVKCPDGTEPGSQGCVYQPVRVIGRLTPTLPSNAAVFAVPPVLLRQVHESLRNPPAVTPSAVVPESVPPALPAPLARLCADNSKILNDPAQSTTAAMLRKGIELRCREASEAQGQSLNESNIFTMTARVAGSDTARLAEVAADQAPSTPEGSVLSLEQRLLVGVTDFVVARAKQELIDYLLRDFSGKLCDPMAKFNAPNGQQPIVVDMTKIFPRACTVLGSALTAPDLSQVGSTFVQALKQDVQGLPQVFLNATSSAAFCPSPACRDTAPIAIAIYQAVEAARTGGSPILAIATAAGSVGGCDQNTARNCGIKFLGVVLDAFAAQYETLRTIDLQNGDDVAALVDLLATHIVLQIDKDPNLQPFVQDLGKLRQSLQVLVPPVRQIVSDVNALRGGSLTSQQKADLSLEIVESMATVWNLGLPDGGTAADRATIVNVVNDVHDAWKADQAGQYDSLIAELFSLAKDLGLRVPLPESVQRYLPLITALTTAQKPEDVTAALEKYAEPAGSWRDKQTGRRSLTLNAFAGGTLGATRATGGGNSAGRFAAFLPVGLDLNLNKSLGLFFSVVDLGNLAEVRFKQSKSDTSIPDVHLKEVVSPGLWFRYSLRNTPFALGAGGSLRRQIGSTQGTTDTFWQVGAFIAVDVPIFSLFKGGGN